MKECILEANLEGQGGIYTVYHFVDLITWELRYPQKRGGNRKKVCWNRRLRHLCTLSLLSICPEERAVTEVILPGRGQMT